jgi:hypothetical protein
MGRDDSPQDRTLGRNGDVLQPCQIINYWRYTIQGITVANVKFGQTLKCTDRRRQSL